MTDITVKKENVLKAIKNLESEDGFYNKKSHPTNYGLASLLEDLFPEAFAEQREEKKEWGISQPAFYEEQMLKENAELSRKVDGREKKESVLETILTDDRLSVKDKHWAIRNLAKDKIDGISHSEYVHSVSVGIFKADAKKKMEEL